VLTLFVGTSGLGAQRWLGWGPVKIQPSELAKLATVILLAPSSRIGRRTDARSGNLFWPVLTAVIPFCSS